MRLRGSAGVPRSASSRRKPWIVLWFIIRRSYGTGRSDDPVRVRLGVGRNQRVACGA